MAPEATAVLPIRETVMLVFGVFWLVVQIAVMQSWLAGCPRKVLAALHRMVDRARWPQREAKLDARVRRHYEVQRINGFRKFWNVCAILHMVILSSMLFFVYTAPEKRWMSDTQSFAFLFLGYVFTAGAAFPQILNIKTILLWHTVLQVGYTFWVQTAKGGHGLVYSVAGAWIMRTFCGVVTKCSWVVNLLWYFINLAGAVVVTYRFDVTPFFGSAAFFLLHEAILGFLIILSVNHALKTSMASAAHEVKSGIMQSESGAVRRMLSCLCDCTFELDSKLELRRDVPALSSLVAARASGAKKGTAFEAFFAFDADKVRFGTRLEELRGKDAAQCGEAVRADVETLTLRDALGQCFKVDVYFVRYELFDEECFLIGLREHGDHTVSALAPVKSQLERRVARYRRRCEEAASEVAATVGSAPEAQGDGGYQSQPPLAAARRLGLVPAKGQRLSVLRAMQRWVLPDCDDQCCCKYHLAVELLERIAEEARGSPCLPQFYDWRRGAGGRGHRAARGAEGLWRTSSTEEPNSFESEASDGCAFEASRKDASEAFDGDSSQEPSTPSAPETTRRLFAAL